MKFLKIDGCTSDLMEIDEQCISKYNEDELRNILKYMADKLNIEDVTNIIMDAVEVYGQGRYSERCETCGDSTYTSILNI